MTCRALTPSLIDDRKTRGSIRRVSNRHPALVLALALVSCVLLTGLPLTSFANQDPLVEVNRTVHGFNRALDSSVLRPVARTYTKVTPSFMKRGVNNFFANIDDVRVLINDVLQLKFKQASEDAGRLMINTTAGVGGLFEVADPLFGLKKHHEDFGQTLGFWAVGSGPYIELPFIGPSTARDSAGLLVDTLLNPFQLLQGSESISLAAGDGINDRAALLEVEGLISGDEYVFIREAYLQHREFLVQDGRIEDTFGNFDDGFEEEAYEYGELEDEENEAALELASDDSPYPAI